MDLFIDLIYELAIYGKSLSAGPSEVLSMNLVKPKTYTPSNNIYL